jgi:hypothetical protein
MKLFGSFYEPSFTYTQKKYVPFLFFVIPNVKILEPLLTIGT